MGENLSQEELDRLFAEAAGETPGGGANAAPSEAFDGIEELFAEGWAKLAGNMAQSLGHDVTIEFRAAGVTDRAAATAEIENAGVLVHFPVSAGPSSPHAIVLQADTAAKLAALLAGGDPAVATLGAEELQGVLDFMDMSLPIVADGLQSAIGQRAEVGGAAGVNVGDPAAELELEDIGFDQALVRLDYALTVGDLIAAPMIYVLSAAHAAELVTLAETAARPAFAEFDAAGGGGEPEPVRPTGAPAGGGDNINLIMDIELEVVARLGEIEMPIREILKLGPGSIIDIDRAADAPVELVVNDKLVAKGDVVVVQENFGLKITEVLSPKERIESLR